MVPDWALVAVVREQGSGVFAEEWRGRMRTTGRRRWLARRTSSRGEEKGDASHTVSSPRRLAGRLVAPPRPHLLCAMRGAASASTPASCFLPPWHHSCRSTPSLVSHRLTNLPRLGQGRRPWRILRL
ncbi:hypothetical protein VPH35_014753 [Triticum aestivum]